MQNWFSRVKLYSQQLNIHKAISQNGKEDNEWVQVFSNVQNTQTNKATEYMDIIKNWGRGACLLFKNFLKKFKKILKCKVLTLLT